MPPMVLREPVRARVHDVAFHAKLDHRARNSLADVEFAVQIRGHHIEPSLLAALQKRLPMADAGIVHQNVDTPVSIDDLLHAFLHLIVVAHIAVHAENVIVAPEHLFHRIVLDVEDGNLGTLLHELLDHAAPKTVGTAGYQGYLVNKPLSFHCRPPNLTHS